MHDKSPHLKKKINNTKNQNKQKNQPNNKKSGLGKFWYIVDSDIAMAQQIFGKYVQVQFRIREKA